MENNTPKVDQEAVRQGWTITAKSIGRRVTELCSPEPGLSGNVHKYRVLRQPLR